MTMGRLHPMAPSPARRHTFSLAVPLLVFLLIANFVVFLIHVWYFLPNHDHHPHLDGITGLSNIPPPKYNKDGSSREEEFKKRIRSSTNTKNITSVQELKDGFASLRKITTNHETIDNTDLTIVPYDIVPRVLEASTDTYGIVHQLPSVPSRRRMIASSSFSNVPASSYFVPDDAISNLTYFLESRQRPEEEDRPLYIYNPMVLPLDERRLDSTIIERLSSSSSERKCDAAYIAVYRLSNFGNCHGPGHGVPDTYHNYLGIALLDGDLNIIRAERGYVDVVIDLNWHLEQISWSMNKKPKSPEKLDLNGKIRQFMQDCQIFAAPTNDSAKGNQLILLCNEFATPVELRRTNEHDEDRKDVSSETIHFQNHYGTGLQLTALQPPNMIVRGGKNMHFFTSSTPAGSVKMGFLEMWPGGPHESLHIDFGKYPYVQQTTSKSSSLPILKSSQPEPNASFATLDTYQQEGGKPLLIDRDSGSACCVPIQMTLENDSNNSDATPKNLLMGFSHRKTRKGSKNKYTYVSRVYAFEPLPPFNIVARSGFFCLGFSTEEESAQSDNEQVFGAAKEYKLAMKDVESGYCPRIHFVTGIAEKMGDDSTVVISYGVNDCYPRMVEVPKQFLVHLLRPT